MYLRKLNDDEQNRQAHQGLPVNILVEPCKSLQPAKQRFFQKPNAQLVNHRTYREHQHDDTHRVDN